MLSEERDHMRTRLRVKEVAAEKYVSMTKLHKKSDVAYTTIRKIFRDPYSEVHLNTLNRLAKVLDVAVTDLIESVPDEPETDQVKGAPDEPDTDQVESAPDEPDNAPTS